MKTFRTLSILFALIATPAIAFAGNGHGDKDGADRKARHAERLATFDTDGDGKLDQVERAAAREARMNTRFNALDSDGNGVISRAEFKAGAEARHDKRVKDGKGKRAKDGKGKRAKDAKRAKAKTGAKQVKVIKRGTFQGKARIKSA